MKAVLLLRTGSATIQTSLLHGPPTIYRHPGAGISFSGKNSTPSPKSSLHFHLKSKNKIRTSFQRSASNPELIRSEIASITRRTSIRSSPGRIAEEEDLPEQRIGLQREEDENAGSLILKRNGLDLCFWDRVFREDDVLVEELEFSGGGIGKGKKSGGGSGGDGGGGSFGDGNADQNKIGAYYQQMLKSNPGNPLLLRNYGKFLHEVEKDYVGAEEYYGRAILASPGDGEVLSLYGKLIWETQRDQRRAQGCFDQAIKACPDNCYVLGSYAHFLWDAEEDEEGGGGEEAVTKNVALSEAH
ncbi:hypothetical protein MRB53_025315 [Persea americana]|uniref:Uncharacterized protein n=1 Tax=Persea americana TaxID=3435 RepID=A0ACC2LG27_PERAE|nr:hypothetical protein MRB53_025315 [Persea americana]|eukprot:TRINITY_DN40376_c0_g1_i1.p1 TRINITY_DN40376_c0_g1~~TRINITY_DN40376_c0_g1_i1.p1  ORF type:complete len:300 (-),score=56.84 TRINITY_DN40376_c0_g1_i1:256-1155(-)